MWIINRSGRAKIACLHRCCCFAVVVLLLFFCCVLLFRYISVAADESTAVVAAAGVKRIDPESRTEKYVVDLELSVPLLLFCCSTVSLLLLIELLSSSIAGAPAVTAD